MNKNKNLRSIERIALLQEYANKPWTLKEMIPEVAAKGYQGVAFFVFIGQEEFVVELAAKARNHDLEVMVFTGFMKYQAAWLKDHPEQTLRLNQDSETVDQDNVNVNWGCPFNPSFQERYFVHLRALGAVPNMTEVWLNDEAFLGFAPDKLACYCAVCRQAWAAEFGGAMPRPPFKDRHEKARFVRWRFRRWNEVHARMKAELNRHHSVRAVFGTSPACCVDMNPWVTGVDLAAMVEGIDGIISDPYYTFHDEIARVFRPREVYMSECCRMLVGVCGPDRRAEICAQGFSHATFTRPLDERDGWWSGVVPAALGVNTITAYSYPLQKIAPVLKPYERSFKLDRYFNRTLPLDFIGVVHSVETQCFHIDANRGRSWYITRLFPTTEALRHQALPYGYVDASRLRAATLARYPVVVLPSVTCLSAAMRATLRVYVEQGGTLMAFGETATRDENGEPLADGSWLKEVFGIRAMRPLERPEQCGPAGASPIFDGLPWPDDTTAAYMGGIYKPVVGLNYAVEVEADDDAERLSLFSAGSQTPAIVRRSCGRGQAVFVAGLPANNLPRADVKTSPRNFIGRVLGNLILSLAGEKLPMRVHHFADNIPMFHLRPVDARLMPTAEFMPCAGERLYLATIASYFREPMRFEIEARLPAGAIRARVRELVAGKTIRDFRQDGNRILLDVVFGHDDCLRVYAFEW